MIRWPGACHSAGGDVPDISRGKLAAVHRAGRNSPVLTPALALRVLPVRHRLGMAVRCHVPSPIVERLWPTDDQEGMQWPSILTSHASGTGTPPSPKAISPFLTTCSLTTCCGTPAGGAR